MRNKVYKGWENGACELDLGSQPWEDLMIKPVTKPQSTILQRCHEDELTRLVRKYNLFYRAFDSQKGTRVTIDGREFIMMASNEYLGLNEHPKVVEAGKRALDEWGSGTTGARPANGSRTYHLRLEEKLASFLGREACHVSAAGYLSCMSAVASFVAKGDLIVVDRNVHSSLWSGIRMTGARVERFAHNNPSDLGELLAHEARELPKLVVVEGVYSMEGHIARLGEMLEVSEGHNCFWVVDDAHGLGVMGEGGCGTVQMCGLNGEVDVICGSLSKAFSSTGGFVAGAEAVVEYLRVHSKQTIFSAAISPSQAACAEACLDIMVTEPEHRERLWENTRYYKQLLKELDLDIWESESPAVPIVFGQKERAFRVWKSLYDKGIFTVLATSPSVPPGKDLLRTAVSARHTREDLERVAEALSRATRRFS